MHTMWYISIVVLLLLLSWFLSLYIVWIQNKETDTDSTEKKIVALTTKTTRFLRKIKFFSQRIYALSKVTIQHYSGKIFFLIFPNAKRAFTEKDELTGLKNGPSSYFLMSVSEYKDEVKKVSLKRGRNRKIV